MQHLTRSHPGSMVPVTAIGVAATIAGRLVDAAVQIKVIVDTMHNNDRRVVQLLGRLCHSTLFIRAGAGPVQPRQAGAPHHPERAAEGGGCT